MIFSANHPCIPSHMIYYSTTIDRCTTAVYAESLTTDNYFCSSRGESSTLLSPLPSTIRHVKCASLYAHIRLHACIRNTTGTRWNVNKRNYQPTTTQYIPYVLPFPPFLLYVSHSLPLPFCTPLSLFLLYFPTIRPRFRLWVEVSACSIDVQSVDCFDESFWLAAVSQQPAAGRTSKQHE